jgi:hypothetical protein
MRFSEFMAHLDRVEKEVGATSKEEEAALALAAAAEQQQGTGKRGGRRGSILLPIVSETQHTSVTPPHADPCSADCLPAHQQLTFVNHVALSTLPCGNTG